MASSSHTARHSHKKRFGQHFLHDVGIVQRIVRAIAPKPADRIVEIGPGEGVLTIPLLRELGKLTVIELDRDLLPHLQAIARDQGVLDIIHADVLKVDFTTLAVAGPLRVVGNLPYNISTPILFHCIAHLDAVRDMHFMLQKEVVERMAAEPGSKTYGRLSVMLQLVCEVDALFAVPASAFQPPPKVESAVVRLTPRPVDHRPTHEETQRIAYVVRAAFGQRRKTLSNSLRDVVDVASMQAIGIDPRKRAEQLAPSDYVALARAIGSASQATPEG